MLEASTLRTLLDNLGCGPLLTGEQSSDFPADKGAYLLLIELSASVTPAIRTLPETPLPAGQYIYCGSANGPGGLRARLRRHLAREKKPHWHVDQLTLASHALRAIAIPGGHECDLRAALQETGKFQLPFSGFGASDCKSCDSHLLVWAG